MYQVLARKYRPKNFHQLLGQEHVAKALINAINHQRLHHAYLFTGTRGVGKTTIARILAKCLNCETGITSEPCGVCSTCVAIDAGRFIDLIEIDAASRTKVEDTRELLDNVPYAPTQGRYKVYLIDEVHMLSTHSFNALLKTLEEPPEHVKFLLATTDPQKLPITIISRCLQFVLRPLPQPQLADYLGKILSQEDIKYTTDALWQLASSARGSVRDALSLTDQAIAFGNGQIGDDTLTQMLGLIDQADVVNLLTLICQQNTQQFAQALQMLRQQVVDAKAVFDRLAEVLHQVALVQLLPDFDLQLQRQQQVALEQLAHIMPAELVQLYYEIVVKSRENISLANTPAQALEMCLLRMLAFKPLRTLQVTTPNNPVSPVSNQLTDATKAKRKHQFELQPTQAIQLQSESQDPTEPPLPDNPNNLEETVSQSATVVNDDREGELRYAETDSKHIDSPDLQLTDDTNKDSQITQHPDRQLESSDDLQTSPNEMVENTLTDGQSDSQLATQDNQALSFVNAQLNNSSEATQSSAQAMMVTELKTQQYSDIESNEYEDDSYELDSDKGNVHINREPSTELTNDISTTPPIDQQIIIASPLDLLQPEPQVVEGSWTPEKWDYWVAHAREQGWLTEDNLALAKMGVMQGEIGGKSQFLTDEYSPSLTEVFTELQSIIKRHLTNTQIELRQIQDEPSLGVNKPNALQIQREQKVLQLVTAQIEKQPVVQALVNQQASVSLVKINRN